MSFQPLPFEIVWKRENPLSEINASQKKFPCKMLAQLNVGSNHRGGVSLGVVGAIAPKIFEETLIVTQTLDPQF